MTDTMDAGRLAIVTFFETQWANATPYGLPEFTFVPTPGSVRMTIAEGDELQGTIGRVQNVANNVGVVMFQIYTAGGTGTKAANELAETLKTMFRNKTLSAAGVVITDPSQAFVRFSPPELGAGCHPKVVSRMVVETLLQTNVNCPFVRYQLR